MRIIIVITAFLGFLTASTAVAFRYLKPQPPETLTSPLSTTLREVSGEVSSDVLAAAVQEEVPTPTASPSPASLSPSPKESITPTLTLTPTPDPVLVDACKTAISSSPAVSYFFGSACFKKAYDEYIEKRKQSMIFFTVYADEITHRIVELTNSREVFDLLLNQCTQNGVEKYGACYDSLKNNSNRLKQEALSKFSSDFEDCKSRIAVGNEEEVERNRDYFWKYKMRENISGLFTFCYQHGNSLNDFHF